MCAFTVEADAQRAPRRMNVESSAHAIAPLGGLHHRHRAVEVNATNPSEGIRNHIPLQRPLSCVVDVRVGAAATEEIDRSLAAIRRRIENVARGGKCELPLYPLDLRADPLA